MSQYNNTDQTTKCLEKLVDDIATDAKLGEFRKTANEKLTELLNGVADEEGKYREDFEELKRRWNEHNEKIKEMDGHLQKCFPVDCFKDEIICPKVIQPLRDKRKKLLDELGNPDYCLELATELHDTTKNELDAWQGITQWIKDRLDKNKALLAEICDENCKDPRFVVYLFYFELRPAHVDLNPKRDEGSPGTARVTAAPPVFRDAPIRPCHPQPFAPVRGTPGAGCRRGRDLPGGLRLPGARRILAAHAARSGIAARGRC